MERPIPPTEPTTYLNKVQLQILASVLKFSENMDGNGVDIGVTLRIINIFQKMENRFLIFQ
jgi:hypothetical protein